MHLEQELAAEAADYGLIYGLEVVNRYETNILNTAQQASPPALADYHRQACFIFKTFLRSGLPLCHRAFKAVKTSLF